MQKTVPMEEFRKRTEGLVVEALADALEEFGVTPNVSLESRVYGGDSPLDSTAVVSMLVDVESRVEQELDLIVSFTDERAISQENSPFRNVSSMVDYIMTFYREHQDG